MMNKNDIIRVVLADDHEIVRKGIHDLLEEEDDIQVVAEATNGVEAVDLTLEHRPDVAVLDIQMPEMSGIEATRQIKAKAPEIRVLVLTAYDDDPYIFAVLWDRRKCQSIIAIPRKIPQLGQSHKRNAGEWDGHLRATPSAIAAL